MRKIIDLFICALLLPVFSVPVSASELMVGPGKTYESIGEAVNQAKPGDKICITRSIYREYDIQIDKSVILEADEGAVLDAGGKGYGLVINADSVRVSGLHIMHTGKSYTKDFAAIYITRSNHFTIENTTLEMVFFGILIEKSHYGTVRDNHVFSNAVVESGSGNGIHLWHCSNVLIEDNELHNLRDGIYFEFVSHSKVLNNHSYDNLRYGLHFMFSNDDEYHHNLFTRNGAGVAVMFSKMIKMSHNVFSRNWGSASYGLLLKEIYDADIADNTIEENTIGIFVEGCNRMNYTHNQFKGNGWAVKISGACYVNKFHRNNFLNNSFDISYNSKMNDNSFDGNYWSTYTGYDLDKNGVGDVPFRPVKLFSYIVNNTPETIVLLRSLFVMIINFSEKVSPVFTPDDLMDNEPLMRRIE